MWRDKLRRILEMLCHLYNGTPCNWGDIEVADAIDDVYERWQDDGCSCLAGANGQTTLLELERHLALEANDLTPGDDAKLDQIVASCYVNS